MDSFTSAVVYMYICNVCIIDQMPIANILAYKLHFMIECDICMLFHFSGSWDASNATRDDLVTLARPYDPTEADNLT
jgi:hypothetical protein